MSYRELVILKDIENESVLQVEVFNRKVPKYNL